MFFDNKQILHLVAELLVLIFIIFHFSQKTKRLARHIEDLASRIEEQEDVLQRHEKILEQIFNERKTSNRYPINKHPLSPNPHLNPNIRLREDKNNDLMSKTDKEEDQCNIPTFLQNNEITQMIGAILPLVSTMSTSTMPHPEEIIEKGKVEEIAIEERKVEELDKELSEALKDEEIK